MHSRIPLFFSAHILGYGFDLNLFNYNIQSDPKSRFILQNGLAKINELKYTIDVTVM
jgi:hypothetical protein